MSARASHHQRKFSGAILFDKIAGVIFAQEEVVVIKLHGVHAVGRGQMAQDRFGARG